MAIVQIHHPYEAVDHPGKHWVFNVTTGENFVCDSLEEAAELAEWHRRLMPKE